MKRDIGNFFQRHLRVVLEFSAGKDSAACLYLLEPYWDKITVVWMNPGNPYPETVEYMAKIRKMVPHFVELTGNQPEWVREFGHPVDVMPVSASPFTMIPANQGNLKLQPFVSCCAANMWIPLNNWVHSNEVTGVIRGQKECDRLKNPTKSGDVVDGIEYLFPIETWDNEQVLEFLGPDRLPASYKRGLVSSLDCMNCTAYVQENPGRIADLELIYPPAAKEVRDVYSHVYEESMAVLDLLEHYHADAK